MAIRYAKKIGEMQLSITEEHLATITEFAEKIEVTVQLANLDESEQLIAEFEDEDGDLMYEDGAIFGKYAELHPFRP